MSQFFKYPADYSTISGGATAANQVLQIALETTMDASLASIDGKLTGPLAVTGPLTDAQLRAAAVAISAASLPLPTGAATSALQTTGNTSLSSIDLKLTNGTQQTQIVDGLGMPVDTKLLGTALVSGDVGLITNTVIHGLTTGGGGGYVDVKVTPSGALVTDTTISGTVPLPTGAATETTLAAINTKTPALGQALAAASVPVVLTAAQLTTLTPLSTVAATQSGTWNITNISGTVSLPTGAATETTLSAINGKLGSLGQKTMSASAPVVIASDQSNIPVAQAGMSKANTPVYLAYTSTSVTTSAYVQLVASTTSAAKMIEIFDSSGEALYLAVGAAASEVNQLIITPGGNGQVPLAIPAGSRISIKALTATASVGFITINLYT